MHKPTYVKSYDTNAKNPIQFKSTQERKKKEKTATLNCNDHS